MASSDSPDHLPKEEEDEESVIFYTCNSGDESSNIISSEGDYRVSTYISSLPQAAAASAGITDDGNGSDVQLPASHGSTTTTIDTAVADKPSSSAVTTGASGGGSGVTTAQCQQAGLREKRGAAVTAAAGSHNTTGKLSAGEKAVDSDDSIDEESRCAVCFLQMVHPVRLPCNHIFCFLCVKGVAITSSRRCALCRQAIPAEFLLRPTLVHPTGGSALSSRRKQDAGSGHAGQDGQQDADNQWYYEGRNGWWKYDQRTSKEIEASYMKNEETCQIMVVGLVFIIDFSRMLQYRIKDPSKRRRIKRDLCTIPVKGIAGISLKRLGGVEEEPYDSADDSMSAGSSGDSAQAVGQRGETRDSAGHGTQFGDALDGSRNNRSSEDTQSIRGPLDLVPDLSVRQRSSAPTGLLQQYRLLPVGDGSHSLSQLDARNDHANIPRSVGARPRVTHSTTDRSYSGLTEEESDTDLEELEHYELPEGTESKDVLYHRGIRIVHTCSSATSTTDGLEGRHGGQHCCHFNACHNHCFCCHQMCRYSTRAFGETRSSCRCPRTTCMYNGFPAHDGALEHSDDTSPHNTAVGGTDDRHSDAIVSDSRTILADNTPEYYDIDSDSSIDNDLQQLTSHAAEVREAKDSIPGGGGDGGCSVVAAGGGGATAATDDPSSDGCAGEQPVNNAGVNVDHN